MSYLRLAALVLFSLVWSSVQAQSSVCDDLEKRRQKVYGFKPSDLSREEMKKKGKDLDDFWNRVRQRGPDGVVCLRKMLTESEDSYFCVNGSALLLSMDTRAVSLATAAEALAKADLDDGATQSYMRQVIGLGQLDIDIQPLAEKYLNHPDVRVFLARHYLTLGRFSGGLLIYGSMDAEMASRALRDLLSHPESYVRKAAIEILSLQLTNESITTLDSLRQIDAMPDSVASAVEYHNKEVRNYINRSLNEIEIESMTAMDQMSASYKRMSDAELKAMGIPEEGIKQFRSMMENTLPYKKDYSAQEIREGLSHIERNGRIMPGLAGNGAFIKSAIAKLSNDDIPLLHRARRRGVLALSDEVLHEYYAVTAILLGLRDRALNAEK